MVKRKRLILRYTYVAPLAFRNTAFCSVSHAGYFKGNILKELQNILTPKEQLTRTQQLWAIWIQFTSSYLHRIDKAFWSLQIFFRISSGKNEIQWNLGSRTPLFTNNSVHEQIFQAKKVSDDERCLRLRTRKLATAASWEYQRGSVSCWLSNLVSVYEHFDSRTASRNELSSWTEVPP
jgi:hypothetical protein